VSFLREKWCDCRAVSGDSEGDEIPIPDNVYWSVFQKTQVALVKSRLVIRRALQSEEVVALPVLRGQPDPEDWLTSAVRADFPQSPEILRIWMSGDNPDELRVMLKNVVMAYLEEVVNYDRKEGNEKLNQLREVITKYEMLVVQKQRALRDVAAKASLPPEANAQQLRLRLAQEALDSATKELRGMDGQLRALRVEVATAEAQAEQLRDQARQKAAENLSLLQAKVTALTKQRQEAEEELRRLTQEIKQLHRDMWDLSSIQEEINNAVAVIKMANARADVIKVELAAPSRAIILEDATVRRNHPLLPP
jgi:hypothetical protein